LPYGIDQFPQAVELFGIAGRIAVNERIFEFVLQRFGLSVPLPPLQGPGRCCGSFQKIIHIRIAAHNFQVGNFLFEGRVDSVQLSPTS